MRRAEETGRFGIWEADVSRSVITLSAGMLVLNGLPADSKLEYSLAEFSQVVNRDWLSTVKESAAQAFAARKAFQVELMDVLPDGSERWQL